MPQFLKSTKIIFSFSLHCFLSIMSKMIDGWGIRCKKIQFFVYLTSSLGHILPLSEVPCFIIIENCFSFCLHWFPVNNKPNDRCMRNKMQKIRFLIYLILHLGPIWTLSKLPCFINQQKKFLWSCFPVSRWFQGKSWFNMRMSWEINAKTAFLMSIYPSLGPFLAPQWDAILSKLLKRFIHQIRMTIHQRNQFICAFWWKSRFWPFSIDHFSHGHSNQLPKRH